MNRDLSNWSDLWESGNYVLLVLPKHAEKGLEHAMIYNTKEHAYLRIHDDDLALDLKNCMKDAGVPVLTEKPPGKHLLEWVSDELSASGMEHKQILEAYKELRAMKMAGVPREQLEKRLAELKGNA
jgi:hypothetical protein